MFHPAGGRVCLLPAHRAAAAAPRPEAILPRVRKWLRPAYDADSDPIVSGMTLPESRVRFLDSIEFFILFKMTKKVENC